METTPLHLVSQYGHFDVCKYICDNTMMVAPIRSDRLTPYTLANHRGHFKVANLLKQRDTTPNILGNVPYTILIAGLLVYIFICSCLFFALDFLQYSFSGVSIAFKGSPFNNPVKINFHFLVMFFLCLPRLIIAAKDFRFSFWTSPKLDY